MTSLSVISYLILKDKITKKICLLLTINLLFLLSGRTSPVEAAVIFSDSFQGGYNTNFWEVANGALAPQASSFGIGDTHGSTPYAIRHTVDGGISSNSIIKIDVKINSYPSDLIISNTSTSGRWSDVFLAGSNIEGGNPGQFLLRSTWGNSGWNNWDMSAGIHHFEFDLNNGILTLLEDGNIKATWDGGAGGFPLDSVAISYLGGDSEFANYQLCDSSGCVTTTPTPTPTPFIGVSPSSATVSAGTPFNVDVIVDGGGQAFNAAQATVAVSSGLSVTGLHNPSSNACNFQYTQTPSVSNPSFAGAIYSSSSTNCNVYTLTLTPTGDGTVTLTNASIKSYADSSEILSTVQNGTFTVGTPTPTPTPSGTVATIDDSVQGAGQNQWNYNGTWSHCIDCNDTATFYNSSVSWSKVTNDYVTIMFTGTQIKFYGVTDPRYGIGAVSIDNGAETNVDFYSPTRIGDVLLWTSPTLSNSAHTLKLRVTGNHNASATDNYVVVDRGDITSMTTLPNLAVNTYPLDTYSSSLQISGTKDAAITQVFVNGSDANTTYPTSTTWEAQARLRRLKGSASPAGECIRRSRICPSL